MEIDMIDDKFWLNYAKVHTEKAVDTVNAGADKLDSFLTWSWTIYTTVFTAGIFFNSIEGAYWSKIIMALPVIIIPIAKMLCIQVQLPVFTRFYPNVPDSIVTDYYGKIIITKNCLFNWAKAITTLGIVMIGVALFLFKLSPGKKYVLKAKILQNHTIILNAVVGTSQPVNFWINGNYQDTATKKMMEKSIQFLLTSNKMGEIDTVISSKFETLIKAYAKWNEGNNQIKIVEGQVK